MAFTIEYYHPRTLATIESWPVDVVADDERLVELLAHHDLAIARQRTKEIQRG